MPNRTTKHSLLSFGRNFSKAGGGVFQGIQKPEPHLNLPALVLFADATGTTLAVRLDELSAEKIRIRIAEAQKRHIVNATGITGQP